MDRFGIDSGCFFFSFFFVWLSPDAGKRANSGWPRADGLVFLLRIRVGPGGGEAGKGLTTQTAVWSRVHLNRRQSKNRLKTFAKALGAVNGALQKSLVSCICSLWRCWFAKPLIVFLQECSKTN